MSALGELSAGIAHEINNPLAIIHATARSLLRFAADPVQLKVRVETIQKSSERIAKIIQSLKKFSRSDDTTERNDHSLSDIIKESLILTEAKAKSTSTLVTVECESEALISCSEVEIEQVLINIIINGIDAAEENRNSSSKWVKITVFEDAFDVVLQIRDSGPGIADKIRKRLFEPFATSKPVGQGTGLGLSIVKGIVEGHGGKIELLSGDPYTCFELRFPRVMIEQNAA